MRRTLAATLLLIASTIGWTVSASALTCPSYTYTFSNGTTADATQVNANFATIANCANTLLAPIDSPVFTTSMVLNSTLTDAGAGNTDFAANIRSTLSPTGTSGANSIGLGVLQFYDTGNAFIGTGYGAPSAALFDNYIIDSGAIAEASAAQFWGLWASSGASSLGTVSAVEAISMSPIVSFGNSLTTTITKAIGLHVIDSQKNTFDVIGQAAVAIDALSAATNNTALLIGQTTVPTGNFGIYVASTNTNYLNGNVGIGTSSPAQKLEVNGKIKVDSFGSATATTVCQLSGILSSCSSSRRYKENIHSAPFGLSEVLQMRPVTFDWKGRHEADFGLIAEDVAKINPLFVTYKEGRVEGIKYGQLTAVLINAVKELRQEVLSQKSTIANLNREVSALQERQANFRQGLPVAERLPMH